MSSKIEKLKKQLAESEEKLRRLKDEYSSYMLIHPRKRNDYEAQISSIQDLIYLCKSSIKQEEKRNKIKLEPAWHEDDWFEELNNKLENKIR